MSMNINIIKVKVKINKKSFNTYFKRFYNKFLNSFSIILFNFRNILISFIFIFKPKKINSSLFLTKYNYFTENKFNYKLNKKYYINVYNF